jgi:hypothetical protein
LGGLQRWSGISVQEKMSCHSVLRSRLIFEVNQAKEFVGSAFQVSLFTIIAMLCGAMEAVIRQASVTVFCGFYFVSWLEAR